MLWIRKFKVKCVHILSGLHFIISVTRVDVGIIADKTMDQIHYFND